MIYEVIRSHGIDVFVDWNVNQELASQKLNQEITGFKSLWRKLIYNSDIQHKIKNENLSQIEFWLNEVSKKDDRDINERVSWVRQKFWDIRSSFLTFQSINENQYKSYRKEILNEITEVLRLTSLVSLQIGANEIDKMILDVETFRKSLFHESTKNELEESVEIVKLLSEVIKSMENYIKSQNIEIKKYNFRDRLYIKGNRNELYTAFSNLIHNAVKYSWKKTDNERAWVDIEINHDVENITITIENWGVPIRKKELETGSVFRFGWRGASSEDRDRKGTGVGLWHAKKIIEYWNGSLQVQSNPISGNRPDDYSLPFITKVIAIFKEFKIKIKYEENTMG
ncbi:MAG: HAMP domain-containing histidine kinase [Chitinophagaceae bacterium]|nr:HAMP domain-containing histidine kinase [Chitinophagaceae bacterium]